MKKLIHIFILFIFTSCKTTYNEVYLQKLDKCINSALQNDRFTPLSIDYYDLMQKIEALYLQEGLLENISKSAYAKLFKRINQTDFQNIYKKQRKIEKDFHFSPDLYVNIQRVFVSCPVKVSKSVYGKPDDTTRKHIFLFNSLEANGVNSQKDLLNYLNFYSAKDLKNIVNRANLIYLTMLNIDNRMKKKYMRGF